MTGLPMVQVLLDNGAGTFPYDITTKTRVAYGLSRGRADEQSSVTPGQIGLTLDNNDGRFTLGSTIIASPSPVTVNQRIRVLTGPSLNTGFETDVSGYTGSNATLARSTAQAHSGSASMSITATTAATALAVDSGSGVGGLPVRGSATYSVAVWARAATTARLVQLRVDWWDAAGGFISTSTGTSVSDATGSWTLIDEDFASPSNAAYARRQVLILSPAAGEVHYVDDFALLARRFTGYVQQWPVEWPAGGQESSLVRVVATDAQARAERRPLRSIIEEEVRPDGPVANYTLGEPEGAVAAGDSSGSGQPSLTIVGSGAAVVFGSAAGPGTDGLTAATITENGQHLYAPLLAPITNGAVEIWFSTTLNSANTRAIFPTGSAYLLNGALTVAPAYFVADGLPHHYVRNYAAGASESWLDGQLVFTGGTGPSPTDLRVGGDGVSAFPGSVAHVAAYSSPLSSARIAAHYQAGSTGFAGESSTARLTRLAGYADIPIGTLDTSLTNVAFKDITGQSVADAFRDVADAEMGLTLIDGSGNLTFHNRNRVATKTAPDITITTDELDPGTAFMVDTQGMINYFEVTAEGTKATQAVRDTTSETAHGRYSGSASYLVSTDAEAFDRGSWVVSTHDQPGPRVGTLIVDLMSLDATTQAALLSAEPNTWIRVTGLPSQAPGGTTANLIVQGFTETLTKDSWEIGFNVADQPTVYPTPWILGDATYSVLGSTTRLYV